VRIYATVTEAMNETARDLLEMGRERRTQTMQDKVITDCEEFFTKELTNISFCVTEPMNNLDGVFHLPGQAEEMKEYAEMEFADRIEPTTLNPGRAWKTRKNVWNEFRERNKGRFAYTYNERIRMSLDYVIEALRNDINSRQAVLSIWNPVLDPPKMGIDRVPCSLYYQFITEPSNDDSVPKLNIIYAMRSLDLVTHMPVDIYLAIRMLGHVSMRVGCDVGKFFMNVASLHYYKKDGAKLERLMKHNA